MDYELELDLVLPVYESTELPGWKKHGSWTLTSDVAGQLEWHKTQPGFLHLIHVRGGERQRLPNAS